MRGYGVVLSNHLAAVVDEIRNRTDRSITEVFILALETVAVVLGLVDRVEDIYTGEDVSPQAGKEENTE